jgi:hypothetical protein
MSAEIIMRGADLEQFLDDLREFLEDQADAEYVTDDPAPRGNDAMKLLVTLNELFPEEGR